MQVEFRSHFSGRKVRLMGWEIRYSVAVRYVKGLHFLNFTIIEELRMIVDGITGDKLIQLYPLTRRLSGQLEVIYTYIHHCEVQALT